MGEVDVALGYHVNDLSKSAGHSDALRRNGNLRPVPHPHLHGNDGIKETASFGGLFISPPTKGFIHGVRRERAALLPQPGAVALSWHRRYPMA